jgi:hypothetical protein
MGFKDVQALLIEALKSGSIDHEIRPDIQEKNLLYTGEVDQEFVIRALRRCAGWEYSTSKHHFLDTCCHTFTPQLEGERWCVKAYFRAERVVFISVHR